MAKLLVVYYSRSGNTKAMAELIADGAQSAGAEVSLKTVADTSVDDLLAADAIIMGSPTYYGTMAAELKKRNYEGVVCLTAEYSDAKSVNRLIAEDIALAKSLFE